MDGNEVACLQSCRNEKLARGQAQGSLREQPGWLSGLHPAAQMNQLLSVHLRGTCLHPDSQRRGERRVELGRAGCGERRKRDGPRITLEGKGAEN